MTTLREFYDMLDRHDWYYDFSDDHSVWTRGMNKEKELNIITKESPEHEAMFDNFHKHYFSGKAWNTPKHPKPERPE